VDLTPEAAERAVREGVPLLRAGGLSVDPGEVAAEMRRTARNLAETAEVGTAAQRTAATLARADVAVDDLLGPALDGDRARLAREAERLGADASALGELLDLALQPFLWEAAAQVAARTDLDRWDRGFCPVCAAWPALAELVGPEKRRVLRCVRCGSAWSWLILLCPYCGNDDHRSLGALQPEGSAQRVDTCESCRGYVKAIPSYAPSSALRLIAEDAVTLDLDVAATEQGYTRPGTVDVAGAGIPRLVREGRALLPRPSRPA
jgi:FdhE protein